MQKIIIHADDFGVSHGVNEAIRLAFVRGVLTSTSIRTNGVAFRPGVELLKQGLKRIGLGLHLNLTDGKPHTRALANKRGFYKYTFFKYLLALKLNKRKSLKLIRKELEAQFNIAKRSGITLDHVDGQDHIHMIPEVFELVCLLCKKHKVSFIRLAREPFYFSSSYLSTIKTFYNLNFAKHLLLNYFSRKNIKTAQKHEMTTNNFFFGVLYTNNMNEQTFLDTLKFIKKNHIPLSQIACHPAIAFHKKDKVYTSPFFKKYTNLAQREMELNALLSKKVKNYLVKNKFKLSNFSTRV